MIEKRPKLTGWTDVTDAELQALATQQQAEQVERLRRLEYDQIDPVTGRWRQEGNIDLDSIRFPSRDKPETDM